MKLAFTASARMDLVRLRAFIAEKNPDAAAGVSQRLRQSLHRLAEHPELGHVVADYENIRDWVAGPYVVRYLMQETRVVILRVWHGREDR